VQIPPLQQNELIVPVSADSYSPPAPSVVHGFFSGKIRNKIGRYSFYECCE
jgi:hypothetical protein